MADDLDAQPEPASAPCPYRVWRLAAALVFLALLLAAPEPFTPAPGYDICTTRDADMSLRFSTPAYGSTK